MMTPRRSKLGWQCGGMSRRNGFLVVVALVGMSLVACRSTRASAPAVLNPGSHRIAFPSRGLMLTGYLWIPNTNAKGGSTRYPAIVWNHGSDETVPSGQG